MWCGIPVKPGLIHKLKTSFSTQSRECCQYQWSRLQNCRDSFESVRSKKWLTGRYHIVSSSNVVSNDGFSQSDLALELLRRRTSLL